MQRRRKKILFVCYGGGHVNMVVPVVQRVLAAGQCAVQVLALTTAAHTLARAGIAHLGFKDFLRKEDVPALRHGERLADALGSSPIVARDETVAYLGLNYADLEAQYGVAEAASQYARFGRHCFLPLGTLQRIVDQLQPDVVVATNSPRAERAAIVAAQQRGIPALCMIDLFGLQDLEWTGKPDYAQRICVLDEHVRQLYLRAGRKPDEVVVTGNPAFDRLADPDIAAQAAALRAEQGFGQQPLILWVSAAEPAVNQFNSKLGDPDLPRKVDRLLFEILRRRPGWRLAIRPHPSENLDSSAWPQGVVLSTQVQSLPAWLGAADAVLLASSTAGMEAALLGRPVVQLLMSVFSQDAPYVDMGIARGVANLNDLERGLADVLEGRWRPHGSLPQAGSAAQRVHETINILLGSH